MRTLRSTVNVHRSEKGGSVLAQLHANLLFEDKVPQQGSKNERNIAVRWERQQSKHKVALYVASGSGNTAQTWPHLQRGPVGLITPLAVSL